MYVLYMSVILQTPVDLAPVSTGLAYGLVIALFLFLLIKVNYIR